MDAAAKPAVRPDQRAKDTRRRKAKVRLHRLGHYIIRHKGKDIYLGLHFQQAQQKAISLLGADKVIVQARPPKKSPVEQRRWVARTVRQFKADAKPLIVLKGKDFNQAAGALLDTMRPGQADGRKHLSKTLGPFLEIFGNKAVHALRGEDLLKFRAAVMRAYSPKTVNHHIASVRRLLRFIYELEWIEHPYRVELLKTVPLPPAPDKAIPVERIRGIITAVAGLNMNLARMLLLQFYGVMRTSEVPKVVHRHGEFEPKYPFVFRLSAGKTDLQTGEPTRVILIPEAQRLLEFIEPRYPSADRYGKACTRLQDELKDTVGPWSPGPLRHSASTILADHGVDDTLIRAAEHHAQERVIRVYRPPPYAKVREAMSVLAEAVPLEVVSVERGG